MPPPLELQVRRLTPTAILPTRATAGAAGLDLYADEEISLLPGCARAVPTGIAVAIPPGHVGMICGRSSLALDAVAVLGGVVDHDYRGEVKVILCKCGLGSAGVERGQRIAQLLILPLTAVMLADVLELPPTARGAGGFGSTGR